MSAKLFCVFVLLNIIFSLIGNGQAQNMQRFKTVKKGNNENASPWQFTAGSTSMDMDTAKRDTSLYFLPGQIGKVCAYGMWALYNRTNYGELFESSTSVITIRGFEPQGTCASTTMYPAFNNVQSLNYLGNPNPTVAQLDIYQQANFLGPKKSIAVTPAPTMDMTMPTAIDPPMRLGSIAITGVYTPASPPTGTGYYWRLCADAKCEATVICINMNKLRGGLYLNRNVQSDTTSLANGTSWPLYIKAYYLNVVQNCETSDINLIYSVARSDFDFSTVEEGLEIDLNG